MRKLNRLIENWTALVQKQYNSGIILNFVAKPRWLANDFFADDDRNDGVSWVLKREEKHVWLKTTFTFACNKLA